MASFASVEQNLLAVFRHFAATRESGEVREMPGVSIASAGVNFHMFNAAFLSEPVNVAPLELERRIATAALHFRARDLRWAYWVCDDKLEPAARQKAQGLFRRNGLRLALQHPGMFAECVLPHQRPPAPLEIRRVETEGERLAFCHVNAAAFRMPTSWCLEVYDLESVWRGDLAGYVGYLDGEPLSTAAVFPAAGAAGIYCVSTMPGHGRKGYAETMVRHALDHARQEWGLASSVLQATPEAIPLYLRMGYKIVTHFSVYSM